MKVTEDIAQHIWVPILIRLRHERTEYDYRAALEVSGGIRRGHSAQDMLDELRSVLTRLESEGLVQPIKRPPQQTTYFGINFENPAFYFTDKFDEEVRAETTRQEKQLIRERIWHHWVRPSLIGFVSGAIGGVVAWMIIEKLLK